MKSISGIVCYVKDTKQTAKFYKTLGFTFEKNEPNHISIRLNWFWIDFHPQDKKDIPTFQKEVNLSKKGAGLFLYISVANVDAFYQGLLKKGVKPASKPEDYPWGNREFLVRDPDGYKLVFFQRI
jgi:catechol 2,3-dioxygenase-like lactoylglutathione lyase family enzyme